MIVFCLANIIGILGLKTEGSETKDSLVSDGKEFEGRVRVVTIMTGVKSPYILGKPAFESTALQTQASDDLGIQTIR